MSRHYYTSPTRKRGVAFFQPPAKVLIQVQVALFQLCQKGRALFGGASRAHDAVAGVSCLL